MSWLRDHFYEFVFPSFLAAGKKSTEIGCPCDVVELKEAPIKLPTELRKLWTLCKMEDVEWSVDIREYSETGGYSKYRASAQLHHKILKHTLDSACAAMKHEKCNKLLLGGRDVWAYVVLCERRGIPYMFVPELSRFVACDTAIKEFLESKGFTGDELFLDTGFMGSIPRSLTQHFKKFFSFRLMSQTPHYNMDTFLTPSSKQKRHPNQLFPNRRLARAEALETEYLAKYWKTGTVKDGEVVQYLAEKQNIQRAAVLTSRLWRGM